MPTFSGWLNWKRFSPSEPVRAAQAGQSHVTADPPPPAESGYHNGKERWLLLANCQTFGLANSFNLLNSAFDVTGVDIWTYRSRADDFNRSLRSYFRVVVQPECLADPLFEATAAPHLVTLPPVVFDAYHPDLCYAFASGGLIRGQLYDYQSVIAVAGYNAGLTVDQTVGLFNAASYERCGYFDLWDAARDRLISNFATIDLDLRSSLRRWGERRAFMYSLNHPRIEVLFDIANAFMRKLGVPTVATDVLPPDNLANGPCFPVYPEIGEALGVRGSYLFKVVNEFRFLTLGEFVAGSFATFAEYPPGSLSVNDESLPRYQRVRGLIDEIHGSRPLMSAGLRLSDDRGPQRGIGVSTGRPSVPAP